MGRCADCKEKVEDEDLEGCSSCSENFCDNCLKKCEECDEVFCNDCYTSSDHECDVGFEVIISYKNTGDDITFIKTSKEEAEKLYAEVIEAVKSKKEFFEHDKTFIVVSDIRVVDLRL